MYRTFVFLFTLLICLSFILASAQSTQEPAKHKGLRNCTQHTNRAEGQPKRHVLPSRLPAPAATTHRHACPTASEWWPKFVEQLEKTTSTTTPQTWTILFYDDADFSNAYDPFPDFSADAHSDVNVDVLVLHDTNAASSFLWYVNETHATLCVDRWGEIDMGDYVTLRDFIAWGKAHYPADRYLLALYDHGGGWAGACTDVTDGGWLSMDDMKRALNETGGVDLICFTAPCLMGAVESVYELRDYVDIYIGSQELSGFAHWHGIFGDICGVLNDSADLTNEDVAEQIIQFVEANQYWPDVYKTMSAVKASAVGDVVQHVDAFSQYAISNMWTMFSNISQARSQTWEMGANYMEVEEVDLYDFAVQYGAVGSDPVALQHLQNLTDALDQAIVAECHGVAQLGANGLSIYFADAPGDYNTYYTTVALDIVEDTQWDEFLNLFLNYDVAVQLQSYASFWKADHTEIIWSLKDVTPSQPPVFNVSRRAGTGGQFIKIANPEIERNKNDFTYRDFSVRPGEEYTYRIEVIEDGLLVTSFETNVKTPAGALALHQNNPNPFYPDTRIEFVLPEAGRVRIEVFDISGKRVKVLTDGIRPSGSHEEVWNGRNAAGVRVASGMYFYRLTAGKSTITKKCVLLR